MATFSLGDTAWQLAPWDFPLSLPSESQVFYEQMKTKICLGPVLLTRLIFLCLLELMLHKAQLVMQEWKWYSVSDTKGTERQERGKVIMWAQLFTICSVQETFSGLSKVNLVNWVFDINSGHSSSVFCGLVNKDSDCNFSFSHRRSLKMCAEITEITENCVLALHLLLGLFLPLSLLTISWPN